VEGLNPVQGILPVPRSTPMKRVSREVLQIAREREPHNAALTDRGVLEGPRVALDADRLRTRYGCGLARRNIRSRAGVSSQAAGLRCSVSECARLRPEVPPG